LKEELLARIRAKDRDAKWFIFWTVWQQKHASDCLQTRTYDYVRAARPIAKWKNWVLVVVATVGVFPFPRPPMVTSDMAFALAGGGHFSYEEGLAALSS
jgi:hypothetical protein